MDTTNRTTFITSLLNRRGDIQANINRIASGMYRVTITDLDCGEILATSILFPVYGDALAYATDCVTGDDDTELPF